jgi:hypothetical protein
MSQTKRGSSSSKTQHLTAAELRRLPKPRGGFQLFAPTFVTLLRGKMPIAGIDPDEVLELVSSLQGVDAAIADAKNALALALETKQVNGSSLWRIELAAYAHAKVWAKTDPEIARAIEPFETFLKKGRHKKQKTPVSSTATSTTAGATAPASSSATVPNGPTTPGSGTTI